jgi:predicted GIY-YIG superfamily endonuclease
MKKPVRILGKRQYPDRGAALRAEHALKKLRPIEKRSWAAASEDVGHDEGQ